MLLKYVGIVWWTRAEVLVGLIYMDPYDVMMMTIQNQNVLFEWFLAGLLNCNGRMIGALTWGMLEKDQ